MRKEIALVAVSLLLIALSMGLKTEAIQTETVKLWITGCATRTFYLSPNPPSNNGNCFLDSIYLIPNTVELAVDTYPPLDSPNYSSAHFEYYLVSFNPTLNTITNLHIKYSLVGGYFFSFKYIIDPYLYLCSFTGGSPVCYISYLYSNDPLLLSRPGNETFLGFVEASLYVKFVPNSNNPYLYDIYVYFGPDYPGYVVFAFAKGNAFSQTDSPSSPSTSPLSDLFQAVMLIPVLGFLVVLIVALGAVVAVIWSRLAPRGIGGV